MVKKLLLFFIICIILSSFNYAEKPIIIYNENNITINNNIKLEFKDLQAKELNFIEKIIKPEYGITSKQYIDKNKDIIYDYQTNENGFKEKITINKKPNIDFINFNLEIKNEVWNFDSAKNINLWDKDNFGFIKARFLRPFYILNNEIKYLDVTYNNNIYSINISPLKDIDEKDYPIIIDPTYYESYGALINSTSYYIKIKATDITDTNKFTSTDGVSIVNIKSGEWIIYCDSNDRELSRAKVIRTLFLNYDGDSHTNPSSKTTGALIYNVTGLTALETSDSNDIGKKAYLAMAGDGNFDTTGGLSWSWNFTNTSGNVNISVWSDCRVTHGTANVQFPIGTTICTSSNTYIGLNQVSKEQTDAKNISGTLTRGGTSNGGNRYAEALILAYGSMNNWQSTNTCDPAFPCNNATNVSFNESYGIPALSNMSYNYVPSTINTATIIPSIAVDKTDLMAYCNVTNFNNTYNITYYWLLFNNTKLYSYGNTSPTSYQSSSNINIINISNTITTPSDKWLVSCLGEANNHNTSWLNSSSITILTILNVTTYNGITSLPLPGAIINITQGGTTLYSKTGDSNGNIMLNLTNGTYGINFLTPSSTYYNDTFTITTQEQLILQYNLSINQQFTLYDEKTLGEFNVSDANSITFYLFCEDTTYQFSVTNSTFIVPISCYYTGFRFFIDFGATGTLYREYITNPSLSNNTRIYLVNAKNTAVILNTFVIDDLLKQYVNPSIYVKKLINTTNYQITAAYVDIQKSIGAYLMQNNPYIIEIHSDNKPTKIVGGYFANSAGTITIRLYNVGVAPSPIGFNENVYFDIGTVNNITQNIMASYEDSSLLTTNLVWCLYNNTYLSTPFYCITPPDSNSVSITYPLTGLGNKTIIGTFNFTYNDINYFYGKQILVSNSNITEIVDLKNYVSSDVLNWIITLFLSVIALSFTIRSSSIGVIIICALAAFFIFFQLFYVTWTLLGIAFVISIVSFLKEKSLEG